MLQIPFKFTMLASQICDSKMPQIACTIRDVSSKTRQKARKSESLAPKCSKWQGKALKQIPKKASPLSLSLCGSYIQQLTLMAYVWLLVKTLVPFWMDVHAPPCTYLREHAHINCVCIHIHSIYTVYTP